MLSDFALVASLRFVVVLTATVAVAAAAAIALVVTLHAVPTSQESECQSI